MPTLTPQEEPKATIRSAMKSGLSGMLAPAELLCYAVAFIVGTVIKAISLGFYDGSQK